MDTWAAEGMAAVDKAVEGRGIPGLVEVVDGHILLGRCGNPVALVHNPHMVHRMASVDRGGIVLEAEQGTVEGLLVVEGLKLLLELVVVWEEGVVLEEGVVVEELKVDLCFDGVWGLLVGEHWTD